MSQANIPNITPTISVDRDDALNLLLASIALEELGLAHILNAEGEKLQYVLGTLPGRTGPGPTIPDLLNINKSIQDMLDSVMKAEMFLDSKLKKVTDIINQPQCHTEYICVPIRHICDSSTFPIFSAGTSPAYNGTITITNTGLRCNMVITVTDATGTHSYTIQPDSDLSISVKQVTSVTGQCNCVTTPCQNQYCIGVFEGTFRVEGGC